MSTYRRVGPENPLSARYTPFSRFRMTLGGGTRWSSGSSGTAGPLPWHVTQAMINLDQSQSRG
jgi:hypothetical protein